MSEASTFSMEIDPLLTAPGHLLSPAAVQPGPTHVQPPVSEVPTSNPAIMSRLVTMEATCYQRAQEAKTAMEEYKTFVQEVGYETAATLSPDHWGILKSIKQDLCDDPNDNLVPDHTIGRHYFPEISLGPDLVATDFPAVSNSWTHRAFESSKRQTTVDGIHGRPLRGSKAIKEENRNVMMTYIQDKNGVPADGDTAKAIRRRAAELFHTIATLREDDVPSTWGQVDSNCKDFYRAKICQFWPDLRMCAFNWKADAIASVVYAKWYPQFQGTQHLPADQEEVQGGKRKRQRQDVHPPASSSPLLSQSSSQLQEPVPSPSPPLPPTSPMEEEAPSTMTNPSTDTPFIDDPFSDRPTSGVPATVTARLLAATTSTTATPGASSKKMKKKHPNNTLSPKNLFLVDYYKTHNPVSNDEFKQLWDGLSKDQQKVWDTKSQDAKKAKKATEN